MKKKLLLVLCGTLCILSLCGCGKKSYNDNSKFDRNSSEDLRENKDGIMNTNFELLSCEDVDRTTRLYIVRDKDTRKEYIIAKCCDGVSITERLDCNKK